MQKYWRAVWRNSRTFLRKYPMTSKEHSKYQRLANLEDPNVPNSLQQHSAYSKYPISKDDGYRITEPLSASSAARASTFNAHSLASCNCNCANNRTRDCFTACVCPNTIKHWMNKSYKVIEKNFWGIICLIVAILDWVAMSEIIQFLETDYHRPCLMRYVVTSFYSLTIIPWYILNTLSKRKRNHKRKMAYDFNSYYNKKHTSKNKDTSIHSNHNSENKNRCNKNDSNDNLEHSRVSRHPTHTDTRTMTQNEIDFFYQTTITKRNYHQIGFGRYSNSSFDENISHTITHTLDTNTQTAVMANNNENTNIETENEAAEPSSTHIIINESRELESNESRNNNNDNNNESSQNIIHQQNDNNDSSNREMHRSSYSSLAQEASRVQPKSATFTTIGASISHSQLWPLDKSEGLNSTPSISFKESSQDSSINDDHQELTVISDTFDGNDNNNNNNDNTSNNNNIVSHDSDDMIKFDNDYSYDNDNEYNETDIKLPSKRNVDIMKELLWPSFYLGWICYVSGILWYYSLTMTTAAINSAVFEAQCIFVFLFSICMLKEKVTMLKCISVFIAFIGVALVSFGGNSNNNNNGHETILTTVAPVPIVNSMNILKDYNNDNINGYNDGSSQELHHHRGRPHHHHESMDDSQNSPIGVVLVLMATLMYSIFEVKSKQIEHYCYRKRHKMQDTLLFQALIGITGMVTGWILLPIIDGLDIEPLAFPNTSTEWLSVIIPGAMDVVFTAALLIGITLNGAVFMSVGTLLVIPVSFVADMLFHGIRVTWFAVIGSLLICLGFILLQLPNKSESNQGIQLPKLGNQDDANNENSNEIK